MNDVIYIKKINDRWRVWRGEDGESNPTPAKTDAKFLNYTDAVAYASDWTDNSYNCGVRVLSEAVS